MSSVDMCHCSVDDDNEDETFQEEDESPSHFDRFHNSELEPTQRAEVHFSDSHSLPGLSNCETSEDKDDDDNVSQTTDG